jgi:hypothetical protein
LEPITTEEQYHDTNVYLFSFQEARALAFLYRMGCKNHKDQHDKMVSKMGWKNHAPHGVSCRNMLRSNAYERVALGLAFDAVAPWEEMEETEETSTKNKKGKKRQQEQEESEEEEAAEEEPKTRRRSAKPKEVNIYKLYI